MSAMFYTLLTFGYSFFMPCMVSCLLTSDGYSVFFERYSVFERLLSLCALHRTTCHALYVSWNHKYIIFYGNAPLLIKNLKINKAACADAPRPRSTRVHANSSLCDDTIYGPVPSLPTPACISKSSKISLSTDKACLQRRRAPIIISNAGLKSMRDLWRKLAETRSFASEFNLQANERASASFCNAKKSGKKMVAMEMISLCGQFCCLPKRAID